MHFNESGILMPCVCVGLIQFQSQWLFFFSQLRDLVLHCLQKSVFFLKLEFKSRFDAL